MGGRLYLLSIKQIYESNFFLPVFIATLNGIARLFRIMKGPAQEVKNNIRVPFANIVRAGLKMKIEWHSSQEPPGSYLIRLRANVLLCFAPDSGFG